MVVRPVVLKCRQVAELEVGKMKILGLLCGGKVNAIVKKKNVDSITSKEPRGRMERRFMD